MVISLFLINLFSYLFFFFWRLNPLTGISDYNTSVVLTPNAFSTLNLVPGFDLRGDTLYNISMQTDVPLSRNITTDPVLVLGILFLNFFLQFFLGTNLTLHVGIPRSSSPPGLDEPKYFNYGDNITVSLLYYGPNSKMSFYLVEPNSENGTSFTSKIFGVQNIILQHKQSASPLFPSVPLFSAFEIDMVTGDTLNFSFSLVSTSKNENASEVLLEIVPQAVVVPGIFPVISFKMQGRFWK